jgi:hypothetical protein
MARILVVALSLSATFALPAMADPWFLGDCKPEDQPKYDHFAETVRTATPGSMVYVPKPYPTTVPRVIEDFLYQYRSLHRERIDPDKLPKGEPLLVKGITESTVRYTVRRVENWGADRCGREERRDFLYLMTIVDAASGVEIARVTLSPSGLWHAKSISIGAPVAPVPLSDPESELRDVTSAYQVQGESPEYVVTVGSIYCGFTTPCLAFRHGSDAYLFTRDGPERALFKIAAEEPRMALAPGDVQSGRPGAVPILRVDGSERLLHLGGATWTIARRVDRPRSVGGPR